MDKIKKEKFSGRPDKTLYSKLGQGGYSISEAIAELVDNSIDSRLSNRPIDINIKLDKENNKIEVSDNGSGMDKKTAMNSIILGSSNKKEGQLGQFGLGLKTSAMSLGKKFTIITTKKNSNEEYILPFDEEEFVQDRGWDDFEIHIKNDSEKEKSGTSIIIEKLRIGLHPNTISYVISQLQNRFSPFIANKEVKIKVNNILLKSEKIELIPNSKKYFDIELSNGKLIKGWGGLLVKGSQAKSGFNMYRMNRLIRPYEKLGYQYHPSKMSVFGEVYLDCIPVTHNKREFIITNELYIEFLDKFQEFLKPLLKKAENRQSTKKIEDLSQEVRETLKDNILKAIQSEDEFQELAYPSGADPLKKSPAGELFDKEKRGRRKKIIEINKIKDIKNKKGRTPKKTQNKKERFITIAGKRYRFDWEWLEIEENLPKTSYLDKEKGLIMITLNSAFPGLHIIGKDLRFYIAIYVTEGIVEEAFKANSRPLDRVIELRDKLILKLAKITTDDIEEKISVRNDQVFDAQKIIISSDLEKVGLSERESVVLKMRLGAGTEKKTLQEIGDSLKITRERVRQIEQRALKKING